MFKKDGLLLASVTVNGIYYSMDDGVNWDTSSLPENFWVPNEMTFASPWNQFVAVSSESNGILSSEDGIIWNYFNEMGLFDVSSSLAILNADSSIYIGTVLGLYKLKYNSKSWEPSNIGLPLGAIYSITSGSILLHRTR